MSSTEKTEKPSQRKLTQAKKKGQIFKSKDVIDNLTLIIAVISIQFGAPYVQNQYTKLINTIFSKDYLNISTENLLSVFYEGAFFIIKVIAPFLIILSVVTLIANYTQVGFIFSKESVKFDPKRIDPISGFKRIFSKKSLLELFKFIVKFIILCVFVSLALKDNLIAINTVVFFGIRYSIHETFKLMFSIIIKVILILFAFSFVDYFFQRKIYLSDLKMTKQEVKNEYKETEGDPLIKGKIKEKQREIATSTLIDAAANATVLIANPTHIAICLKYEYGMNAPIVTAIARDSVALKLKEIAKENNVPIVEDRPLARALFNEAEINEPIPSEFFRVVAQLLVTIMNSKV